MKEIKFNLFRPIKDLKLILKKELEGKLEVKIVDNS